VPHRHGEWTGHVTLSTISAACTNRCLRTTYTAQPRRRGTARRARGSGQVPVCGDAARGGGTRGRRRWRRWRGEWPGRGHGRQGALLGQRGPYEKRSRRSLLGE